MEFRIESPFYRLLATKYNADLEQQAIDILDAHPELARYEWPGPDERGQPFVKGSTALHYAANDGKQRLVRKLIGYGADVNASNACWYRSVLSWAANQARIEIIRILFEHGAKADSLDAMHAAAWGGPERGRGRGSEYAATLQLLLELGADLNDRRYFEGKTPLAVALESQNAGAIEFLRSLNALEK